MRLPSYGLALMTEQHPPAELVDLAQSAEDLGFDFAMVSDHYQPWITAQGHGSFVWSVLGAMAASTRTLTLGTGVVCPTFRFPPMMVAYAAATVEALMPGRFLLGLGSGGALNEHVVGGPWPPLPVRLDMLAEALDVMHALWSGQLVDHRGTHFVVDTAQLWGLPCQPPPVLVASSGPHSASLAGSSGSGLLSPVPDPRLVESFVTAGGGSQLRLGWLSVCFDDDDEAAVTTAHKYWPIAGLSGQLFQELRLPRHVEDATRTVRREDVAERVVTGPDPEPYVESVRAFLDAGFTGVYLHQIGPSQEGFLRFWRDELRPSLP